MIGDLQPNGFAPFIPIGDETLLVRLGYIENTQGRLRVTPPGRERIAAVEANLQRNFPVRC